MTLLHEINEIAFVVKLLSLSWSLSCCRIVPSCFVIFDLEPLSLSFDFVFTSEIFKSLSFCLDHLCCLAILCLDQHAHTLHHLKSLIIISLDRLDILKEDLEYQTVLSAEGRTFGTRFELDCSLFKHSKINDVHALKVKITALSLRGLFAAHSVWVSDLLSFEPSWGFHLSTVVVLEVKIFPVETNLRPTYLEKIYAVGFPPKDKDLGGYESESGGSGRGGPTASEVRRGTEFTTKEEEVLTPEGGLREAASAGWYIRGKPNGKQIWKSIQNGPTPHPMITDPPPTDSDVVPGPRKKLDSEFSEEENKLEMADTQAEIIYQSSLPRHIFNNLNQKSTAKDDLGYVEIRCFMHDCKSLSVSKSSFHQPTTQLGFLQSRTLLRHDGHIVTEPTQRKAPGNVGNTGARGKKVICYNCRGEGHVARQCKEQKRKMDSQYFKVLKTSTEWKLKENQEMCWMLD
ncbi:retrovirus-related pol polyprotein from transposon TNT 1-94 [Tanacetum coccineum]